MCCLLWASHGQTCSNCVAPREWLSPPSVRPGPRPGTAFVPSQPPLILSGTWLQPPPSPTLVSRSPAGREPVKVSPCPALRHRPVLLATEKAETGESRVHCQSGRPSEFEASLGNLARLFHRTVTRGWGEAQPVKCQLCKSGSPASLESWAEWLKSAWRQNPSSVASQTS